MSEISVRALTAADRSRWLILWHNYLAHYDQDIPASVTEAVFERLLSPDFHRAFVAVVDDVLVGFVHYLFHDSTWSLDRTCYLEDLYVSPEVRNSGAGRKLIEAVYNAADVDPQASGKVYWHTDEHNERARRLYDGIGVLTEFVRYDRP